MGEAPVVMNVSMNHFEDDDDSGGGEVKHDMYEANKMATTIIRLMSIITAFMMIIGEVDHGECRSCQG